MRLKINLFQYGLKTLFYIVFYIIICFLLVLCCGGGGGGGGGSILVFLSGKPTIEPSSKYITDMIRENNNSI